MKGGVCGLRTMCVWGSVCDCVRKGYVVKEGCVVRGVCGEERCVVRRGVW